MQLENTFTIPAGINEAWAAFNDPFTGTVKVKLGPISLTYKGKGTFVERDDEAHKVVIEASGRDSRGNGTASATVTGTLHADGDAQTTVKMVTDMTVTGRPAQFGRGVMADVSDKIIGQFSSCLANKLGPHAESSGEAEAAASSGASASSSAATEPKSAGSPESPAPAPSAIKTAPAPVPSGPASANGAAPKLASAPEPYRSEVDAIDLLDTAGAPVLKRLAPVVLGLLALFVLFRVIKGRRS